MIGSKLNTDQFALGSKAYQRKPEDYWTTAQKDAYQSRDGTQIDKVDHEALEAALVLSRQEYLADKLISFAKTKEDRFIQIGSGGNAQVSDGQVASSCNPMHSEHAIKINQEHVYDSTAQANNTKMRDWCANNGVRPLAISGDKNNCLIRCLVAANSTTGQTVDEAQVEKIAGEVRKNNNDGMLMPGEQAATDALGMINEERKQQGLPPFYLLEIQPAEDGPQIIQYGDDKDGAPLPVVLMDNHFQLLVLDESLSPPMKGAIALRQEQLTQEIKGIQQNISNASSEERGIYQEALQAKKKELACYDKPWQ